MWKYAGISFVVLLLTMLCVGSAAAQGHVIPFTVIEIECSEEPGEITEGEDIVRDSNRCGIIQPQDRPYDFFTERRQPCPTNVPISSSS